MPEIMDLQALSDEEKLSLLANLQRELGRSERAVKEKERRRKKSLKILYLTEDEISALFRSIDAEGRKPGTRADPVRDRALFELALGRGLRASEVGLIELKHVDTKRDRIYITRLKGGRSGEFLLTDREVRALKPWLKKRGWLPGPLFTSRNKRSISRRRLDEMMKLYGASLPYEKRHFHCLRHTCATRLLERGMRIEEVQDILGHEDIRNTSIYAKITSSMRIEIGEKQRKVW